MGINIRQKGAEGEREVAKALEPIIRRVYADLGFTAPTTPIVQRNQNQSAVGGSDLSNTFGLAIEVKRQETLSVGSWWKQCEESARRNGEVPVLVYRQSRKAWRVVMYGEVNLPVLNGTTGASMKVLMEISWEQFLQWFEQWVKRRMLLDESARV
jgi:hypothetical protein